MSRAVLVPGSGPAVASASLPIERIRNIGIMAHIDAGKTTTTERILFYAGVIQRLGEVHDGSTVTDWMEQEQERGISITAAATTFRWRAHQINLIDTPGHVDFTVEVERSLRVLDGAIAVFCAVNGVEPQSETVWRQARRYGVPRLAFINKCDREGADVDAVLAQMVSRLDAHPVLLQLPYIQDGELQGVIDLLSMQLRVWDEASLGMVFTDAEIPADAAVAAAVARDRMVEAIAESDDVVMERFVAGEPLDRAALVSGLRRATLANRAVPTLVGAAFRNKGVHNLLDAVVDFLPSPLDVPPVRGIDPRDPAGASVVRRPALDEPLAALAFKLMSDESDSATLTYLRVYSGRLRVGESVLNATKGKLEQISRLVRMHANHREEVSELTAGHIGASVGLRGATTGDTLCDPTAPVVLASIDFPAPVIGIAIEPLTEADFAALGVALETLAAEDPTFLVHTDVESQQTLISGMGELHLEILVDRLRREFGVAVRVGQPRVAYRETVGQRAEAERRFVRPQAAGPGHYGHVRLVVEPTVRGQGYVYEDQGTGEAIPRRYLPAVRAGVSEAVERGVLAGYPVTDVRVSVVGGSAHPVDSSDFGYKMAGLQAFQTAARNANMALLEPVMGVEVVSPDSFLGDVIGDLHARRGKITGIEPRHGVQVIAGFVPLASMFGYATDLRSRTQGRATYSMQFKHYAEVPHGIADEIVARVTGA